MIREDKICQNIMATAGGVAFIIPKKWSCLKIDLKTTGLSYEALAVIIIPSGTNPKPFKLLSVYNHPGNHFPHQLLTEYKNITFNGKELPGLLLGDLNCPHTAFGSRTTNEFGSRLLQALNQENLVYFNDGAATYFSNSTGLPNVLDLVIADASMSRWVESCKAEGQIGSDHVPVKTTLSFDIDHESRERVNLSAWAEQVDLELSHFELSNDINDNIDAINSVFLQMREKCARTFSVRARVLPLEIRQNIKLRKILLRRRKNAPSDLIRRLLNKQYNRVNHLVQRQIKDFDEAEEEKLATSICDAKSTSEMWSLYNKYKNKNKSMCEPENPLKNPDNTFTANSVEKCNEFARHLRSVHQTPDTPFFDNEFKREVDEGIRSIPVNSDEADVIGLVTVTHLRRLLQDTKQCSAPGEDMISYDLLKICQDSTLQVICNLFNQCLKKRIFPDIWKRAKVRMLLKPGKDKEQASSYRPISLLPCLGKLFERLINQHLVKALTEKQFINNAQAGFSKGRSSQEHLFRLAQGVSNGFKERNCTVALFVDVKAAFDSVWVNGLKHKIRQIGLPVQLEKLLFSFLDNRSLRVFIDGSWSDVVNLGAGTPQGSSLSPTLYLIFVNDLPSSLDQSRIAVSQFADDVSLWSTQESVTYAATNIQGGVERLEKWCRKWHVSLNPSKSQIVIFTKCPRHKEEIAQRAFRFMLFNENVPIVPEATFLGVTFDSRLTWEPQVRKLVSRAYKRLNLIRIISSMSKRSNPERLASLYKSIIRPLFEYSSLCIVNAAEVHLEKLQLVQNQSIRVILKTPRYVSIKDLHDCSGIKRITDHLVSFARGRFDTMRRSSPLIEETLINYNRVRHIRENASCLDVIGS